MLSLDAMRALREVYPPQAEAEVLARLGNPTREAIIETALAGMTSEDRNVRVLMLRVLAGQSGPHAMQGILIGLNDPMRRVREVAIKSSAPYHEFPEITARLRAMVVDEAETRRIRGFALNALTGQTGEWINELTEGDAQALQTLAEVESLRMGVLFGLLRLELTPRVADLLRDFVTNGSKEEAVMATRALCGFRVMNLGSVDNHPAAKEYVAAHCDIAAGRVWYWVPRAHYAGLLAGQVP